MIAYLKGQIKAKGARSIVLVVGEVGYQVNVPEHLLLSAKEGNELELYTHLVITQRDETQELYGFPSHDELQFFQRLISITGVGPRSALAALSVARLPDLKQAIARGDPSLLQKVAGIGKKTAERIVVELRDKLEAFEAGSGVDGELITALENLGYKAGDIRPILAQIPADIEGSGERLKAALKILGR